jgi:tetratricopeptide (TPR) repeat protein
MRVLEDGVMFLQVTDERGNLRRGINIILKGRGSIQRTSDEYGKVRIELAPGTTVGSRVSVAVTSPGWVLEYPRGGWVQVPPFDPSDSNFVTIVVRRTGHKSPPPPSVIKEIIRDAVMRADELLSSAPKADRLEFLTDIGIAYGVDRTTVARWISEWLKQAKENSTNPCDKGMAALYDGRFSAATEWLEQCKNERKNQVDDRKARVRGAEKDYADSCFLHAQSLYGEGRYLDSIKVYKEAHDQRPDDSGILNGLGLAMYQAGMIEESLEVFKQSLGIRESRLSPDDAEIAVSYNNLGEAYSLLGNNDEARQDYEKALEIRRKALLFNRPEDGRIRSNLGSLYFGMEDYEKAASEFVQAWDILRTASEADYIGIATTIGRLATVYTHQCKLDAAAWLLRQADDILWMQLGPQNPVIAEVLNSEAVLDIKGRKFAEAERRLKEALPLVEAARGPKHLLVAVLLNNLAEPLAKQRKYEEAEGDLNRSLIILKEKLPSPHRYIAEGLGYLATVYRRQNRNEEAERLYKQSLEMWIKLGNETFGMALTLENYAELLQATSRESDAIVLENKAKAIIEKERSQNQSLCPRF